MRLIVAALTALLAVASCSQGQEAPADGDAELDRAMAWRILQEEQECPDVPQDDAAKKLIADGQQGTAEVKVYGEDDPYDRQSPILKHLWSRPNPKGAGTIVTAVRDGDGGGLDQASRSRYRAIWLVLDGEIYPLNVEASQAFGRLSSGLPPAVAQEAGLDEHAIDSKAALGIEEFITYRWHGSADPLPACE